MELDEDVPLGPEMKFLIRVYQMTEAENAEGIEQEKQALEAGFLELARL
jgi:hypothetical protein